ncbi:MAG TPA: hypothetical protein VFT72_00650 [Opitutaceae bacterium]|nr:hypothetical protein [Opitutaceae bacterium]
MSDSTGAGVLPETRIQRDDRFPPGIPYIVGNEAAERFSFYGMRQILYVYLAGLFSGFVPEAQIPAEAKVHATQVIHLFIAGVYLFPLIGAILADRLLGKYRVIFWVSLVYVAGHAVLAVAARSASMGNLDFAKMAVYGGLLLISLGSGGIKPCVSANVGDQFTAKNGHLIERVFQIFYFTINFGAFFSTAAIPWVYKQYGPELAFGIPGVLMAVAAFIFWLGRRRFVRIPPQPGGSLGVQDFIASSLMAVPLLIGIHVLLEESDPIVNAATEHGIGAIFPAIGAAFAHYWLAGVAALASFVAGVVVAQLRQRRQEDAGFFAQLVYCLSHRGERAAGEDFWAPARRHFGAEAAEGPPAVLRICVVFSAVSVFWALYDQYSSTWVEQARGMDLVLNVPRALTFWWLVPAVLVSAVFGAVWLMCWVSNRPVSRKVTLVFCGAIVLWGIAAAIYQAMHGVIERVNMLPAQMGAANPLFIMLVIPILTFGVYEPLKRRGRPLKPLTRMTIGMFLASVAYVVVALLQARIDHVGHGVVHVLWQSIPYLLITTAEVLVSVTGLEFAYTQAPRAMKSTIMGFWLLGITFGNVLVAFLAPLQTLSLQTFFWTFAALMAIAAVVFSILAASYRGKTYLQEGEG